MIKSNRRHLVFVALGLLVLIWTARLLPWDYRLAWVSTKEAIVGYTGGSSPQTSESSSIPASGVLPNVELYYDQAFSVNRPRRFDYADLKDACSRPVEWHDDVYLKCIGIAAGMTSIMNQVKVCFKMAIDSGANLLLPSMPLRDSKDLLEFNFLNQDAYMTYDQWFDVDHLREVMSRACPRMKILHPSELNVTTPVKYEWEILNKDAQGYVGFGPFFWVGNPYETYFESALAKHRDEARKADAVKAASGKGVTIATVDSKFVLYRITDDPTGRDLRIWNDLSRIIRFKEQPREIAGRLVAKLKARGAYYAVHFRAENDTIWSPFEHQLQVDLDGLDAAWKRFGSPGEQKPVVYLACGDEGQADRFVAAGAERGWDVTHKWKLLDDDPDLKALVNKMAFDFQGAVDLAIMVRGQFFFGITGSAFSSTVSQLRDPSGRYRGSSLLLPDDAGARSHLFFDGDAGGYPCCL
ncbi:hypothetical protein GQ53DRAFT_755054 [Thozetella sp. PMI_491]|nr:hypothetical protein GQ53DRAFT_755054 [Thozetella sp. PMI_491]